MDKNRESGAAATAVKAQFPSTAQYWQYNNAQKPDIIVVPTTADGVVAWQQQEAARIRAAPHAFVITGATGTNSALVNGAFLKEAGEVHNSMPIFKRVLADRPCGGTTWLRCGESGAWYVSSDDEVAKNKNYGYAIMGHKGAPLPSFEFKWQIHNANQPALTVTAMTRDTLDQWIQQQAAFIQAAPYAIVISDAAGELAFKVNGTYLKVPNKTHNGMPLYRKDGTAGLVPDDNSTWLRLGPDSRWHVSSSRDKDRDSAHGIVTSVKSGALLPSTESMWRICNANQPAVTLIWATTPQALQDWRRTLEERIAMAPHAYEVCDAPMAVNGMYVKMHNAAHNGAPLYRQTGPASTREETTMWLRRDPDRVWCICRTRVKDKNEPSAAAEALSTCGPCDLPPQKLALKSPPGGGGGCHNKDSGINGDAVITVMDVSVRLAGSVAAAPLFVLVRGAFGDHEIDINGVFHKVPELICNGEPLFKHRDRDTWLRMSYCPSPTWFISDSAAKDTDGRNGFARGLPVDGVPSVLRSLGQLDWLVRHGADSGVRQNTITVQVLSTDVELSAVLEEIATLAQTHARAVAVAPAAFAVSGAPVGVHFRHGTVIRDVNGIYRKQATAHNGRPYFTKRMLGGLEEVHLRYGRDGRWHLSPPRDLEFNCDLDNRHPYDGMGHMRGGLAYSTAVGVGLPHTDLDWHICVDSGEHGSRSFVTDHTMVLTAISTIREVERIEEHEIEMRVTAPHAIVISDADETTTAQVDGVYVCVPDVVHFTMPAFRKRGRSHDLWLRFGPSRKWLISEAVDFRAHNGASVMESEVQGDCIRLPSAELKWSAEREGRRAPMGATIVSKLETAEELAAFGAEQVRNSTTFPPPWTPRWDIEWCEVVFDNADRDIKRLTFPEAFSAHIMERLQDRATAVETAVRIGKLAPWHKERRRFEAKLLMENIGGHDNDMHRQCMVAFCKEAYFFGVWETHVDKENCIKSFPPLGSRGALVEYKRLLSGNEYFDRVRARERARDFLKIQIELAREHTPLLKAVLEATKTMHLAAYETTMTGIRSEPHFETYAARATEAAALAEARHGRRPVQTTSDVDTLYTHASAVKTQFLQFLERVSDKTKGVLVVQVIPPSDPADDKAQTNTSFGGGIANTHVGLNTVQWSDGRASNFDRRDGPMPRNIGMGIRRRMDDRSGSTMHSIREKGRHGIRGDGRPHGMDRREAAPLHYMGGHLAVAHPAPVIAGSGRGRKGQEGDLVLKNEERVLEKTGLRSDGEKQWEVDEVCDIVRGALEYSSIDELTSVLEMILACDPDQRHTLDAENTRKLLLGDPDLYIHIVRVKDRFWRPTSGGWSDTMINFTFSSDPCQHIMEIQLCHRRMMTVRKEQGAHKGYNQFRSALELLECIGEAPQVTVQDIPQPVSRIPSRTPSEKSTDSHVYDELREMILAQQQRLDHEVAARKTLEGMLVLAQERIAKLESCVVSFTAAQDTSIEQE